MVWEDLKPSDIMSAAGVDNAIRCHLAMGGSTNAMIHVVAMARRAGIPLDAAALRRIGPPDPGAGRRAARRAST